MLATLMGISAVSLGLISMSRSDDGALRKFNLYSLGCWGVYYLILGLPYAAMALLPGVAITFARIQERDNLVLGLNALGLAAAIWVAMTSGLMAAAPLFGSAIINLGLSIFADKRLTMMVAAGQVVWLGYALSSGAWLAAINALLIFAALGMRTGVRTPKVDAAAISKPFAGKLSAKT